MFFIVVQYIIKPSLYQTFLMSYRKQFEKEMNRIEGEKRKQYLEDKYKQLKNKKDTHKSKNKKITI